MNRKHAADRIMQLFIQAVHRYNALEKVPVKSGEKHELYHSERHLLDRIGGHPAMTMTEFARAAGITKGAVSQVVKKLERKGFVKRSRKTDNNREVLLELTGPGRKAYLRHARTNEQTIKPLLAELRKHSDDNVDFLASMLAWINDYLEQSRQDMKAHR